MALGIAILSRGGGFARYSRYLVGDLLSVTGADIALIGASLLAVLAVWALLFNRLCLVSFSEAAARGRGVRVWRYDLFFSMMVAFIVALSVQWIGILVVSSMLVLPAAAARNAASTLRGYVLGAAAASLAACVSGLILSYYLATATGATIVLAALGLYAGSFLLRRLAGASGVRPRP
jgi:zinc transport system permease protein